MMGNALLLDAVRTVCPRATVMVTSTSAVYGRVRAEELPIARSTLSEHLTELKKAGLIQGEINPPYIKYCINRENWEEAQLLFANFFKR